MSTIPLRLEDLDYDLPPELVAQRPAEPRDAARLLVYRRGTGTIEDRVFRELPSLLRPGDLLVRNDTRVFPARAFFRRATGGRVEVLFLERAGDVGHDGPGAAGGGEGEVWEALLRGRPRPGEVLAGDGPAAAWRLRCRERLGGGRWLVESLAAEPVLDLLERVGTTPLPPYIREPVADPDRYQTTYARVTGSAAAPTAGLHFTPALDAALEAAGVAIRTVTLHVGLGTFRPLDEETLAGGRLHRERFQVPAATWDEVRRARGEGRRVVAVGTTTIRVLEHLAAEPTPPSPGGEIRGETGLFIAPGFRFRVVDAVITHFHLPRTSLLALVMAFCGVDETRRLYAHAVARRYRFYSFGDAMLAL